MNPPSPPSKPRDFLEALSLPGVLPARELEALKSWATTFYAFQLEWLFDPSRFALCNKARQIGMSHTTAAAMVLWAAFLGETSTVISIGEREALEVLEKAGRHAKALTMLGSRWAKCRAKGEELNFTNGGRIIALPASSGGRSFSGNVFLDEYGYMQAPDRVWDGAGAVTMHGFRMRVVSTPNGVGNPFHSLVTDPERHKGWRLHEFSLERAKADGMRVDDAALWALAKGDPRLYSQLFDCSFLDGQEQYLPTDKVLAACVAELDPRLVGERYAGLDVGLTNDLTVLTVVEQDAAGVAHLVDIQERKRTEWDEQQAMIEESAAYWGWKRLCVDSTGLGAVPCQLLQKKLGVMRVESVPFTLQSKEGLATLLYQAFNDGMVRMLRDSAMVKDLCSIRRMITSTGAVRYDAPHTADGHADRAWSLALALQACSQRPTATGAMGAGDFGNA